MFYSLGVLFYHVEALIKRTCLQVCEQQRCRPARTRSLISFFIIHFLESVISKLATGEISIFPLVSVVEENDLSLALSEIPKTGFIRLRSI